MRWLLAVATAWSCATGARAEEGFLEQYTATYRFRLGRPTSIAPTPDGAAVLFLRSGPRSFERDLYALELASGEERLLLSAQSILKGAEEKLSAEEKARRERLRLTARGIASYSLSQDGRRILVPLSDRLYVVERQSGEVREIGEGAGFPLDPRFSPDGRKVACLRDGELRVIDVESGAERALTHGASATLRHGEAEFVAQEEMGRRQGYWWAPDSGTILYQETDLSSVERLHVADAVRPESPPDVWPYPRAGGRNARVRLGLVPVAGGETRWLEWDRERYEYLAKVVWEPAGPPTLLLSNRRQTEQALVAVDPATGATRTLLTETDPAWLEILPSVPAWLPGNAGFLWASERSGERQLELRSPDGTLTRIVAGEEIGFQDLAQVFPDGRQALVRGSTEPTESHLWLVPLSPAGDSARRLTQEQGVHFAIAQEGCDHWVAALGPLTGPPRLEVWRRGEATGRTLISKAETPSIEPGLDFHRVGPRALRAVVLRPRQRQPGQRFPVLVDVYGGPGVQTVQADPRRYLLSQWIADQGFVVVALDGRGTPGRGRSFERAIRGDLGEVPLSDQAEGLLALAGRVPEGDFSRVGIFGWSFGGYLSAMAVLRRPDVYKAAVAGAPVTDWRDYDTFYTERFMGLPDENASGYAAASLLTHAKELRRPLLLIHGTGDDNVYFLHSLKLADALFRAGREFEFLPLPGFTHMVPDPVVAHRLWERILGFFRARLGEPG